ncbi:type I site-specific deoxyribonuclease, HsdR family protein [Roseobacter sp. AzwK-3b]|uniref:type I restriction endonuclease subunit R n=1 Tax=Roseobacter sp. AzwK-3b TaxID=351016 RepID=UPI0001569D5D|nr:type I restriction endonuclease subunit R [Roseobacter sp. AzwK-3b]EDM70675.1 type I site-specific deoxyribonuclease, HsdR family protein [Roseobacter sp. AzwK-3b]
MAFATEDDLEQWALSELQSIGFTYQHGLELSPEVEDPVRQSYHDTLLLPRLDAAIRRLNPTLPPEAVQTVLNRVRDTEYAGDLISENRRIHGILVGGVPVTWFEGSEERNAIARLVDWESEENDWLAVNQFEVVGQTARRPDIVLFLNGMPLILIELKGTETGTLKGAYNQIETYKAQIPALFRTNAFSVISEGVTARYGSLSANLDRFMRWRTVDGETLVEDGTDLALQTLIHGLLAPATILELMHYCMVFEDEGKGPIKKIAGYHQCHAVRKAVSAVLRARDLDGRGGVMWHTQGSGKSLLMAFLAGRLMRHPDLENPTVVVITDRNDLDNQLYSTFGRCEVLFGEAPEQAEDVPDLRRKLDHRKVGGVIFATMQKFRPQKGETSFGQLTDRSNVIVFADEAHRSQYGFEAKLNAETGETRYGFAHHLREALPNAVHVGFTGTPISLVGADTQAVFGEYIDVYDIAQAVEDGATVPIYYEGRVAKISLGEEAGDLLDAEYDEILEDAEDGGADLDEETRKTMTRKWSRVEALVGAAPRLDKVVEDILQHFDARFEAMDGGKVMIVCMSRRICVEVYNRIIAARPDWHSDDDGAGEVKVVMTGAAQDPAEFQPHIRSKARLETLRTRYRDPSDPFKLVIVRDMWLTGFDAPCMHTLYTDKPMKGHGLMQAITRINRVFGAKPSGLVVDYIGLAADLKAALNHYSNADRKQTGIDQGEAVHALLTQLDIMRSMFHGVDYMSAVQGTPQERIKMLPVAIEHALNLKVDGETPKDRTESKKRFMKGVAGLVKAFRIASGTTEADEVKDEVGFFTAVQAAIRKMDAGSRSGRSVDEADLAISQLLNRAVTSTEVIDILEAAGIDRPDIGVLSEEFLLGLKNNPHKSLAVEALKKLLNGEIRTRTRTNNTKKEAFSKRLEEALARYHNRSVDALQVIQEMIAIAKALQEEPEDGLSPEEVAFYDALATNASAVELMGNEELRIIATELVMTVQQNARVDWWRRDDIRKKMRVSIRRILRKHGFPPDLQSDAIKKVVQQAEVLAREFA